MFGRSFKVWDLSIKDVASFDSFWHPPSKYVQCFIPYKIFCRPKVLTIALAIFVEIVIPLPPFDCGRPLWMVPLASDYSELCWDHAEFIKNTPNPSNWNITNWLLETKMSIVWPLECLEKRTDRPADRLIFTDLKVFLRIVRFNLENKIASQDFVC